jgi:hypothetical protein
MRKGRSVSSAGFCSQCGHQLAQGMRFCTACGHRVASSAGADDRDRASVAEPPEEETLLPRYGTAAGGPTTQDWLPPTDQGRRSPAGQEWRSPGGQEWRSPTGSAPPVQPPQSWQARQAAAPGGTTGRRSRRPLLVAAIAVLVVGAGAGVAFAVLPSHSHGPGDAGRTAGAGATPTTSAPSSSASSAAALPPRERAARALTVLLGLSGTDRAAVTRAVSAVEACSGSLSQDEKTFADARASRQMLLGELASLPDRSALPAAMLRDLAAAWRASGEADQDFAQWTSDEMSHGCSTHYQSDPSFKAATAPDDQATKYKKAFARQWASIAGEYGLPAYQYTQI